MNIVVTLQATSAAELAAVSSALNFLSTQLPSDDAPAALATASTVVAPPKKTRNKAAAAEPEPAPTPTPAPAPAPTPAPTPAPAAPAAKGPNINDVTGLVTNVLDRVGSGSLRPIFKAFDITKVSELAPERYGDFIAALNKVLAMVN